MSPKLTTTLTVVGVLLAGIPLFHLTQEVPLRLQTPQQLCETPSTQGIYARVQFTGKLLYGTLRFEGKDIATIAQHSDGLWETELFLPASDSHELEAELHWAEGSPENAVSITLEPAQKPAQTVTRWTGADGSILHDLFIFSW